MLLLDIGPPKPKCSKVGGQLRGIDPIAKCTICRQLDLHASSRARASNKSSCPKCTRHAHFMERPTAPNSLQKFPLIHLPVGGSHVGNWKSSRSKAVQRLTGMAVGWDNGLPPRHFTSFGRSSPPLLPLSLALVNCIRVSQLQLGFDCSIPNPPPCALRIYPEFCNCLLRQWFESLLPCANRPQLSSPRWKIGLEWLYLWSDPLRMDSSGGCGG